MGDETISLTIDKDTKAELEDIASALQRSPEELIGQAVRDLIDLHHWQVRRIQEGIAAADIGDYATDEEVKAAVAQWRG
jgi:predicted transcriptional regulator